VQRSKKHGLLAATCFVLAATAATSGRASTRSALPFVEDDYARALAEARSRRLPIFADVWTAW
jgi:endonuclease YncB( thermonuclease family)